MSGRDSNVLRQRRRWARAFDRSGISRGQPQGPRLPEAHPPDVRLRRSSDREQRTAVRRKRSDSEGSLDRRWQDQVRPLRRAVEESDAVAILEQQPPPIRKVERIASGRSEPLESARVEREDSTPAGGPSPARVSSPASRRPSGDHEVGWKSKPSGAAGSGSDSLLSPAPSSRNLVLAPYTRASRLPSGEHNGVAG